MILTPHALVGASVAVALAPTHPILAGVAALASHYALDALPHWDYTVVSDYARDPKGFWHTVGKVAFDGLLGVGSSTVIFALYGGSTIALFALAGALLAVLPDFLLFIEMTWDPRWVRICNWIQHRTHTKHRLHSASFGLVQALLVATIAVSFVVAFKF